MHVDCWCIGACLETARCADSCPHLPASAWCLHGWPAGSRTAPGARGRGSSPGAPGPRRWWGGSCPIPALAAARGRRCCCSGAKFHHLWWAHSGTDSTTRRKQNFARPSFQCLWPRKSRGAGLQCPRAALYQRDRTQPSRTLAMGLLQLVSAFSPLCEYKSKSELQGMMVWFKVA